MAVGLIIIGDEILSGKRRDAHFPKVVELLAERGMELAWAEYLGDDPARITASLARSFAGPDIVFSCGGIGATPDDHTRQCAAAALGVPLQLHPDGKLLIQERTRDMDPLADLDSPESLHRLKMAEFPAGATLIPNPYNKIAGFSVGRHHFVPGFPVMAWPMIAWVLDTHYQSLFNLRPHSERAVLAYGSAESTLTPLMEAIEKEFDAVKVFSLPSVGDANTRRHIELGVKGEPGQVDVAFATLRRELDRMKVEYVPT
jgi:molybdopterin-biosynthesis enzyme MoeA-like protein